MENVDNKNKIIIVLSLIIVGLVAALLIVLYKPNVQVVEMDECILTIRETDDGYLDDGYYIVSGDYEDRKEISIREKDSYVVTLLTYDLEGNLIGAEANDYTSVAEINDPE